MVFVAPSKFFIFLPGDEDDKPSITAEMPAEFHEAIQNAKDTDEVTEETVTTVRTQLGFFNLPLLKPGMIKVRALRNDYLVRLGAVQIMAQNTEAAN
jgi:hypothetical protein